MEMEVSYGDSLHLVWYFICMRLINFGDNERMVELGSGNCLKDSLEIWGISSERIYFELVKW